MKKILFAVMATLLVHVSVAQDFDNVFYVSWNMSKPVSSTADWISSSSARGAKIGYRKMINDRFSAGVDLTWNVFNDYEPVTTFENPTGAVTTDYYEYLYAYGITLGGQYYLPFGTDKVMPYVGLGLGASLNRYALFYNVYTETDNSWGFLATPEVGILFPFGGKIGAMVAAHYDFSTSTSDYFEIGRYNRVGVNVGIVLMGY